VSTEPISAKLANVFDRPENDSLQQRIMKPEEVGLIAVHLAREESVCVTGQVISVDRGYKV